MTEKLAEYRRRGVARVKLGLTDLDGVIRGKYVSLDKFADLMAKGGGFCDCVFGWGVDDELYDNGRYTGWHSGFPDVGYRLLADSERWLADEGCPYFIGEFVGEGGAPHPLCPRTQLRKALARLAEHGLWLVSGFEYEFAVFEETPHSVREKHYHNLRPLTPGDNFGYSMLRTCAQSDLFTHLMEHCRALDLDLEGLHCETGACIWEAALQARPDAEAADRANLFKTFAKAYFQKRGLMTTFMAKWSMDFPGSSGHFHFSLVDAQGVNRFQDAADPAGMSTLQKQAVAGLEHHLNDYLALLAPTVNSYTRLVKGYWAPTAATWGVENRTAAIRIIGGGGPSQRIECRVGGADANPYLAAAAAVAAALHGIEEGLTPSPPVAGNAYEAEDGLPESHRFPSNLGAATDRLERCAAARDLFGDAFVDHFVMSRRWEFQEYERHVNDWQLARYFEII